MKENNMTKYNLLFGLLFLAGVIFPGCEDDETDPFVGTDNYIVSFALNCEGTDYTASFRGDTILLTVPHGVSRSEAVPTLVCSENNEEFRRGWEGFLDGAHIG